MTAAVVESQAVTIGPTWARDEQGRFLLPRRSLGWQILGWTGERLLHPDGPLARQPWRYTEEQARFLLWWYSLDQDGRFRYRRFVLRRMKGWGKDPFGLTLTAIEALGPCEFGGWAEDGSPIGVERAAAWVQVAAVSLDQTRTTMRMFPGLFADDTIDEYGIDIGKTQVFARRGSVQIEAVTSSPRALEGPRTNFTLKNETHHWLRANDGHDMSRVIARNAAKVNGRVGSLTNSHQPGEDSVAEREFNAWEQMAAGTTRGWGLLYDALEAPADTILADAESLRRGLEIARGDSTWLNVPRLMEEIYDPETSPSEARRFYLNQIVAAEDSWTTPAEWETNADRWLALAEGDELALFFDGSKSDDTTGLVACRIADGALFVLDAWSRPDHAEGWMVPREQVDDRVAHTFAHYDPVAFFGDPGTGEDESGSRYWDAYLDKWSLEYGEQLCAWAMPSGANRHAVLWDMRDPNHQRDFTAAAERALADIESRTLPHDGDPRLAAHVANAKRWPNRWGITIGKESRSSNRKIDLAVCAIGARMVRRIYEALPEEKKRKSTESIYETRGMRRL